MEFPRTRPSSISIPTKNRSTSGLPPGCEIFGDTQAEDSVEENSIASALRMITALKAMAYRDLEAERSRKAQYGQVCHTIEDNFQISNHNMVLCLYLNLCEVRYGFIQVLMVPLDR